MTNIQSPGRFDIDPVNKRLIYIRGSNLFTYDLETKQTIGGYSFQNQVGGFVINTTSGEPLFTLGTNNGFLKLGLDSNGVPTTTTSYLFEQPVFFPRGIALDKKMRNYIGQILALIKYNLLIRMALNSRT